MKVRSEIMARINTPKVRTKIADLLGVGEQTIALHMRRNVPDGRLSKMDALNAISKVLGDTGIEDILEDVAEPVTAK